jgi:hypothetical protein
MGVIGLQPDFFSLEACDVLAVVTNFEVSSRRPGEIVGFVAEPD